MAIVTRCLWRRQFVLSVTQKPISYENTISFIIQTNTHAFMSLKWLALQHHKRIMVCFPMKAVRFCTAELLSICIWWCALGSGWLMFPMVQIAFPRWFNLLPDNVVWRGLVHVHDWSCPWPLHLLMTSWHGNVFRIISPQKASDVDFFMLTWTCYWMPVIWDVMWLMQLQSLWTCLTVHCVMMTSSNGNMIRVAGPFFFGVRLNKGFSKQSI